MPQLRQLLALALAVSTMGCFINGTLSGAMPGLPACPPVDGSVPNHGRLAIRPSRLPGAEIDSASWVVEAGGGDMYFSTELVYAVYIHVDSVHDAWHKSNVEARVDFSPPLVAPRPFSQSTDVGQDTPTRTQSVYVYGHDSPVPGSEVKATGMMTLGAFFPVIIHSLSVMGFRGCPVAVQLWDRRAGHDSTPAVFDPIVRTPSPEPPPLPGDLDPIVQHPVILLVLQVLVFAFAGRLGVKSAILWVHALDRPRTWSHGTVRPPEEVAQAQHELRAWRQGRADRLKAYAASLVFLFIAIRFMLAPSLQAAFWLVIGMPMILLARDATLQFVILLWAVFILAGP